MTDFRIDNQKVELFFDEIAVELMNKYDLKINNKRYQLTELEFYFFCEQHPDGYTYNHNENAGKLRFHYSGVDITLRSKKDNGYGGILIREIRDIENSLSITGPLKVVLEISNSFTSIFEQNTIQFVDSMPIREYQKNINVISTERINLKKVIEHNKYKTSKYRFKLNN